MTDAEIVDVYNSNNEKFNAFRYNLEGVFYYYVIDNIQFEWTDDLSYIGYSDKPIYTAYISADKVTQKEIGPHLAAILYDKNGNKIDWNSDWGSLYNYDVPYSVISVNGNKQNPLPAYPEYTVSQAVQFSCAAVSSGGFPVVTNYYLSIRLNQSIPDSVNLSLSYITYVDRSL